MCGAINFMFYQNGLMKIEFFEMWECIQLFKQ